VIDGWCSEDWNAKHALIELPTRFDIIKCSKCERAKISGRWQPWNVVGFLREKAKVFGRLDSFDVTEKMGKYTVRATGIVERGIEPKTEEHVVIIKFNKLMCPDCSRAVGGYYEAILQLRGEIPENAATFFEREAAKILAMDSRAFWSAKELKEGFDIKLGNTKAAIKLAELFKQKYKAEIKKSYQLVGRKDGKDIHRTIIAVRFKQ
jgi:NMD protein affecting ribosome stability and mRNA decay